MTVGGVTLYELAAWCACPNAEAQLEFSVEFGRLDDPEFCSSAVEFLVAALDGTNPGFAWLGADGPATEETNLDWLLHRRVRDSVRGARSLLRGYSWTTVCPEELSQKLGGPAARRDGGLPRGLPACCGRSRAAGDQDGGGVLGRRRAQGLRGLAPCPAARDAAVRPRPPGAALFRCGREPGADQGPDFRKSAGHWRETCAVATGSVTSAAA